MIDTEKLAAQLAENLADAMRDPATAERMARERRAHFRPLRLDGDVHPPRLKPDGSIDHDAPPRFLDVEGATDTRTCPECQRTVDDADAEFCPACGQRMAPLPWKSGPVRPTGNPVFGQYDHHLARKEARKTVNTEPTDAQKEAGNYRKGHFMWKGLDITLENPKGSTRSGVAKDGTKWETQLAHDYGYFKRTDGADGDHVDVFIGPDLDSEFVAVVDQCDPDSGDFDEHKVIIGTKNLADAKKAYHDNYDDGWKGCGAITSTTVEGLKHWLTHGSDHVAMQAYDPDQARDEAGRWTDGGGEYRGGPMPMPSTISPPRDASDENYGADEYESLTRAALDADKPGAQATALKDVEAGLFVMARLGSNEQVDAVDKTGRVVLKLGGGQTSVRLSLEEKRRTAGCVVTHNHPLNVSLSPDDVSMAGQSKLTEARAVAVDRHGDRWIYSIKPSHDTDWPRRSEIEEASDAAWDAVVTPLEAAVRAGRMNWQDAESEHNHRMWKMIAPKLGLTYRRVHDGKGDVGADQMLPELSRYSGLAAGADDELLAYDDAQIWKVHEHYRTLGATVQAEWDESLHPRDDHGRFAPTDTQVGITSLQERSPDPHVLQLHKFGNDLWERGDKAAALRTWERATEHTQRDLLSTLKDGATTVVALDTHTLGLYADKPEASYWLRVKSTNEARTLASLASFAGRHQQESFITSKATTDATAPFRLRMSFGRTLKDDEVVKVQGAMSRAGLGLTVNQRTGEAVAVNIKAWDGYTPAEFHDHVGTAVAGLTAEGLKPSKVRLDRVTVGIYTAGAEAYRTASYEELKKAAGIAASAPHGRQDDRRFSRPYGGVGYRHRAVRGRGDAGPDGPQAPGQATHLDRLIFADWDEGDHPRAPAGSPEGGRFVSPGAITTQTPLTNAEEHGVMLRKLGAMPPGSTAEIDYPDSGGSGETSTGHYVLHPDQRWREAPPHEGPFNTSTEDLFSTPLREGHAVRVTPPASSDAGGVPQGPPVGWQRSETMIPAGVSVITRAAQRPGDRQPSWTSLIHQSVEGVIENGNLAEGSKVTLRRADNSGTEVYVRRRTDGRWVPEPYGPAGFEMTPEQFVANMRTALSTIPPQYSHLYVDQMPSGPRPAEAFRPDARHVIGPLNNTERDDLARRLDQYPLDSTATLTGHDDINRTLGTYTRVHDGWQPSDPDARPLSSENLTENVRGDYTLHLTPPTDPVVEPEAPAPVLPQTRQFVGPMADVHQGMARSILDQFPRDSIAHVIPHDHPDEANSYIRDELGWRRVGTDARPMSSADLAVVLATDYTIKVTPPSTPEPPDALNHEGAIASETHRGAIISTILHAPAGAQIVSYMPGGAVIYQREQDMAWHPIGERNNDGTWAVRGTPPPQSYPTESFDLGLREGWPLFLYENGGAVAGEQRREALIADEPLTITGPVENNDHVIGMLRALPVGARITWTRENENPATFERVETGWSVVGGQALPPSTSFRDALDRGWTVSVPASSIPTMPTPPPPVQHPEGEGPTSAFVGPPTEQWAPPEHAWGDSDSTNASNLRTLREAGAALGAVTGDDPNAITRDLGNFTLAVKNEFPELRDAQMNISGATDPNRGMDMTITLDGTSDETAEPETETVEEEYTPESWDEMSDDQQTEARDEYIKAGHDEYIESEIENWRNESGDAHVDAAKQLLDGDRLAHHDLTELMQDALDENGVVMDEGYDLKDYIVAAADRNDVEWDWHNNAIKFGDEDPNEFLDASIWDHVHFKPAADLELEPGEHWPPWDVTQPAESVQPSLPTVAPRDLSEAKDKLAGEVTESFIEAFKSAVDDAKDEVAAPDFSDSADEMLGESWDSMTDRDRFHWASRNMDLSETREVEHERDDPESSRAFYCGLQVGKHEGDPGLSANVGLLELGKQYQGKGKASAIQAQFFGLMQRLNVKQLYFTAGSSPDYVGSYVWAKMGIGDFDGSSRNLPHQFVDYVRNRDEDAAKALEARIPTLRPIDIANYKLSDGDEVGKEFLLHHSWAGKMVIP